MQKVKGKGSSDEEKTVIKRNKQNQPILPSRKQRTVGQKASDWLTGAAGSWGFIITLGAILVLWMFINAAAVKYRWDPYPFILLNFILSTLAAIQAPIILMSQNRQSEIDRHRTEYDYMVDRKAEREIQQIHKELVNLRHSINKYLIKSGRKKK